MKPENPEFPSVLPATEIVVAQCHPTFVRRLLQGSRNPALRRIAQLGHPNGLSISTADICAISQQVVSVPYVGVDALEIELKQKVRVFKFDGNRACETWADHGIGFSLTDAMSNRAALAYPGFRASNDWRTWCDAKLKEHQKKPSVDREDFLFSEFCRDRPDVVLALAREKALAKSKDESDVQAALVERLRRARAIRMRLESQGVDIKTISWARKNADRIPVDATAAEVLAVFEAETASE